MKKLSFPAVLLRPFSPFLFRSIFCLLWLLVAAIVYSPAAAQKKVLNAPAAQKAAPAFNYKIIPATNGTYGYDLYTDGKLKIHQPTIPAMPGNDGFKTKAAAEKVAALAISKMKKGESLPTISPEELKKLGVL